MEHAYATLNKRIAILWAGLAPELITINTSTLLRFPLIVRHPTMPNTLPMECFQIFWMSFGQPGNVRGELVARLQLDIYVDSSDLLLALRKGKALTDGLGINATAPFAVLPVFDYTAASPRMIGTMRLLPQGSEWRDIPDPNPTTVHLARRLEVVYRV
jgi:hypothetical protein